MGHTRDAATWPSMTTERAYAAKEWCITSRLDLAQLPAAARTSTPTRMRNAVAIVVAPIYLSLSLIPLCVNQLLPLNA